MVMLGQTLAVLVLRLEFDQYYLCLIVNGALSVAIGYFMRGRFDKPNGEYVGTINRRSWP